MLKKYRVFSLCEILKPPILSAVCYLENSFLAFVARKKKINFYGITINSFLNFLISSCISLTSARSLKHRNGYRETLPPSGQTPRCCKQCPHG